MKNRFKLITGTIVMLGFTTVSFAQASTTATATATIVTPIAISKTVDMNFGNVAVTALGGTVVLTPASSRTPTGGVTLPVVTGTVSAASFDVTGLAGYTYAITLPTTDLTLTNTTGAGAETMMVNAFTSTPTPTGTLSGAGAETVTVGATLNVSAAQVAGVYVSGTPFTVTVNYN